MKQKIVTWGAGGRKNDDRGVPREGGSQDASSPPLDPKLNGPQFFCDFSSFVKVCSVMVVNVVVFLFYFMLSYVMSCYTPKSSGNLGI